MGLATNPMTVLSVSWPSCVSVASPALGLPAVHSLQGDGKQHPAGGRCVPRLQPRVLRRHRLGSSGAVWLLIFLIFLSSSHHGGTATSASLTASLWQREQL